MTHNDWVTAVAFSPDSASVVSASGDGIARVWNAVTGQVRARMTHSRYVNSVAFSPDGAWVVTGGNDGIVRVWDAATGQERARMAHDEAVTSVAFSSDGAWVVSGSEDDTARTWLWQDTDLVTLACERIGRNLATNEWQFYLPGQSYRKTCDQWPGGE